MLLCVKKGDDQWALKAVTDTKVNAMLEAGTASYPNTNGLSDFCTKVEQSRPKQRREQEEGECQRSDHGFELVVSNDGFLMAAPTKNQQDGSVEMLPGMNLWEWAVSGTPWPVCGDPGQNEAFQGRDLHNNAGECDKINICHGNAGFGWNRITVHRSSLGEPSAEGAAGHAEEEHNKMHNKRADYFPYTTSVPNPRGAGINGYLDESCGFVCPDCDPNTDAPTLSPTQAIRTEAPTWQPTQGPTAFPTESPTTASPTVQTFPVGSTVDVDGAECVLQADCSCEDPADVEEGDTTKGAHGDPHFVMFNGHHFEFHGGCDLVLLSVPEFNNGQGLTVHIRTKVKSFFSYIERVAVQIGSDVLEVKGSFFQPDYWLNGQPLPRQDKKRAGGILPFQIGGYQARWELQTTNISWKIAIALPQGQVLSLRTVKDYMRVDVEEPKMEYFGSAKGLMGSFDAGEMLSRDGNIVLEDTNEFGQEWQVRDTETGLFQAPEGPQYPQQCQMPSSWWARSVTRRLAEGSISLEDAQEACSHLRPSERDDCVYDVMATGDMELAVAY